jgi:hypothetical protein
MAKGFKSGGRDWKKGESGNSRGLLPMPEELRVVKKLTPSYVKMVIAKLARMSRDEFIEFQRRPAELGGPNMIEMTIGSILMKAVETGDHSRLNFILDRSIGKTVEERNVTLRPVTYTTSIRGDGSLLQAVLDEESEKEGEG